MKEINRNILLEGLASLPKHKAPEDVWDNIETIVFAIPPEILPIHSPGASIWNSIETQLDNKKGWIARNLKTIALLLLLFASGSLLLWNITDFSNNDISSGNKTPQKELLTKIIPLGEDNTTKISKSYETKADIDIITQNESESSKFVNNITSIPISTDLQNNEKQLVNESNTIITNDLKSTSLLLPRLSFSLCEGNLENGFELGLIRDNDELKYVEIPQDYCNFNRVEKNIFLGIGVEYQYFFNNGIPVDTKMKYWISGDLRILFKRERFTLETGIGIGLSSDKTNFTYNYLTNELVDSYEYVDSVHYNPITGTTEYFTTTVDVYDSVAHASQSAVNKDYRYLQVPLIVGWDIIKTRQTALNLHVGMVYIKEINFDTKAPNLYHENSRITTVNSVDVARNSELFRVGAGLRFNLCVTNKLSFIADPSLNYYFNNIYKNSDIKSSMSLSIRCGLYFKL